jgi:hypothetical protein
VRGSYDPHTRVERTRCKRISPAAPDVAGHVALATVHVGELVVGIAPDLVLGRRRLGGLAIGLLRESERGRIALGLDEQALSEDAIGAREELRGREALDELEEAVTRRRGAYEPIPAGLPLAG